jgi:hypothetical protein
MLTRSCDSAHLFLASRRQEERYLSTFRLHITPSAPHAFPIILLNPLLVSFPYTFPKIYQEVPKPALILESPETRFVLSCETDYKRADIQKVRRLPFCLSTL